MKTLPINDSATVARFWRQVAVKKPSECWLWQGAKTRAGYGTLGVKIEGRWKTAYAHRFSLEIHKGSIPEDQQACHNCPGGDNPLCVNPYHLFAGSNTANSHDARTKGRLHGRRVATGQQVNTAKLDAAKVIEIRDLSAGGMSSVSIGRRFEVSHKNILSIVHRRTWKHV